VVDTLPKLLRNCPRVSALLLGNWIFSMKSVLLVLVLLALLAATLWWAVYAWTSVDVGNEHSRVHRHDTRHRLLAHDRLRAYGPHVLQQLPWIRRITRLALKANHTAKPSYAA
jgi:hypothetical protein